MEEKRKRCKMSRGRKSAPSERGGAVASPQMDRWGDLSTSWPLSQEVVSWAAEKSDYLLLPVPPTECERVCVGRGGC